MQPKSLFAIFASILSAYILLATPVAHGMLKKLTAAQREDAILYGKKGTRSDVTEFIKEWSVNKGKDGFAFIQTEFLGLAYAARQAALGMAELDSFEIEDTLAQSSGKLVFRVTLFGNTPDFARDYSAVITSDKLTTPTTFWNIPIGEPYGDGKSKPAFVIDADFYFPDEGLNPNGTLNLIIRNKDGNDVVDFPFNLGSIR